MKEVILRKAGVTVRILNIVSDTDSP